MQTFIICGYGLPINIHEDQNYSTYLNVAFNKMFEWSANQEAVLIPCGGSTSCEPPYEGTEAKIIADYLRELMNREDVKEQTKDWQVHLENRSLSTLENLLFAKEVLKKNSIEGAITVFCEAIRENRMRVLCENIFESGKVQVSSIDFDVSNNRYLDPEVLEKKEALVTKEALWTLEDPVRLAKHHEIFEKKFAFLRKRQAQGVSHVDAVEEWFRKWPEFLKELMLGHPLLSELDK